MRKKEIRAFFLKKRADSNPADNERIATRLGEVLSEKPEMKILHSFIANPTKKEVNTRLICQSLQAKLPTLQWAAPHMIPGSRKLESYAWNDKTEFVTNRFGIEEPNPATSQLVEIQTIDAVLVPLLTFDETGHRVGYGGGYYDRFLAQCRPDALKIGLSFFEPVEQIEDLNEWDVRLDICVTPDRIYRWDK